MKTISLLLAVAVACAVQAQTTVPLSKPNTVYKGLQSGSVVDKRVFPRWQEEAIIIDIIHADRCDSIKGIQAKLIENQNEQLYAQGSMVVKLKEADSLRRKELQSYKSTVANQDTLIRYWKRQDIKHRRQLKLVVAAVVVVEVLKFVFTGKLF